MTSTSLITHFDLDGVGSTILAKKVFDVSYSKCQGYGKVRQSLEWLAAKDPNTIVSADLNMVHDDLKFMFQKWKHIHYFDHHISSGDYKPLAKHTKSDKFQFHYSLNVSTTALVYMEAKKRAIAAADSNKIKMLTAAINAYDMWDTDGMFFDIGFNLNEYFWKHSFWKFEKRFCDGFDGFTKYEKSELNEIANKKQNIFNNSVIEELVSADGPSGMMILLADLVALSDVTLKFKEYDKFFIIYKNESKGDDFLVSIRARNKKYNVNDIIKNALVKFPDKLASGGGHAQAGNVVLKKSISTDITKLTEFISEEFFPLFDDDADIPF